MLYDCDEIMGNRTTDTVFTRSSGAWVPNSLSGYCAFSCEAGQFFRGTWLPIVANTETTLTVDGTLDDTGTAVRLSPWNPITNRYDCDYGEHHGNGKFWGGAIDTKRADFWLAPGGTDSFVRFNLSNKTHTPFAHGYLPIDLYPPETATVLNSLFYWMWYDATRDKLFALPGTCPDFVIIDPESPEDMIKVPHGATYYGGTVNPNGFFNFGFMTNDALWALATAGRPSFFRFDLDSYAVSSFSAPAGLQQGGFGGAVYDGARYAYIPCYSGYIYKLDTMDGTVVKRIPNPYYLGPPWYPGSSTPQACLYGNGCLFDNIAVFPPYYGPILLLDTETDHIIDVIQLSGTALFTDIVASPAAGQYLHCERMGDWVVFFGQNTPVITFMHMKTKTLYNFQIGYGQSSFSGAAWDAASESYWTVPAIEPYIFQIKPNMDLIVRGMHKLRNIGFAPVAIADL